MKPIKSVAIIGAGALGLMFMDSIISNPTVNAYFLVDNKRYEQLKNRTFKINNKIKQFPVKSIDDITEKADLILVCVKNYHLDNIRPLLEAVSNSETTIISVLNGITSETYLESLLPETTVLYSAVLGMDAVKEGDDLHFTRKGKFLLGSKNNTKTPELDSVVNFLKSCNLEYILSKDIHRDIWYKWMINIGVNQVSAITGANYGVFQSDPTLQKLMENAMMETIKVAQKENISLDEKDIDKWYEVLKTLGPTGKTSMLQDIEACRKTEVESFAGDLIKIANKHGLDVPVNDTLYRIIKTKEI
ncbi:MAG: ketopantoate reductase family protein [Spirochaetaceae bacterium]